MRCIASVCTALLIGLASGCSGRAPELPADRLPETPAGLPALAALPDRPLRSSSGLNRIKLGEADVVASQGVSFDAFDGTASFDTFGDEMAYMVLGVQIPAGETPVRLDVFGNCSDLWVAVSDYESRSWRWFEEPLQQPALLVLGGQDLISPTRNMYVALACVPYYMNDYVEVAVVTENPAGGDSTAPVWTDQEGILTINYSQLDDFGDFTWGEATDPDSGLPVTYLVYFGWDPQAIDWTRPLYKLDIPEGEPLEYYMAHLPSVSTLRYAVRAMDAAGNITGNTNDLSVETGPGEGPFFWIEGQWEPGDTLVMAWDDQEDDLNFALSAPNSDEAFSPDPFFAGRSFIVGPDSVDSGIQEERVRLRNGAPPGCYFFELHYSTGGTHLVVKLEDASGQLKEVLAEYDLGPGAGGADAGYLRYLPPGA